MKTTSITIERNFHIMNDDRFIMEKISQTIELEESDNINMVLNIAREEIIENFKSAYPHIEEHLNFHVVRQEERYSVKMPIGTPIVFNKGTYTAKNDEEAEILSAMCNLREEKINKGTIVEQIQACTTLSELETFELISKMNPTIAGIYVNKKSELKLNKQTV